MAKIMIDITGEDVQMECLADQLASGVKSGIEGAIHAFADLFQVNMQLMDGACY